MTKTNYIPEIDVSPLYSDNLSDWRTVDHAIGTACVEAGAFIAANIPKPTRPDPQQTKNLLAFYDLPQAIRDAIGTTTVDPNSTRDYRGYFSRSKLSRSKNAWVYNELYDVGPEYEVTAPTIQNALQLIETNAWPSQEPVAGWRQAMQQYHVLMDDFSKRIMRSMIRYLGANEVAGAARFEQSNSTLRLLNYPAPPADAATTDDPEAMREFGGKTLRVMAIEHKDQCCLTLLWQSDVGGLQMQSPSGEWQAIPPVADGVSVHIGLAMEGMSAGLFAATPHRVLGENENARQSIGFFLEPNLHSSTKPFAKDANEPIAAHDDTYAAALLRTFAERAARKKTREAASTQPSMD